jgi:hypothetical protein
MYKFTSELPRRSPVITSRRAWTALHHGWTRLRSVPGEAYLWIAGLLAMAFADPKAAPLIDLCVFEALGASFCPGCGLGHAVAWLARGELVASWHAHPLGIPAVVILLGHTAQLVWRSRYPS